MKCCSETEMDNEKQNPEFETALSFSFEKLNPWQRPHFPIKKSFVLSVCNRPFEDINH